MSVSPSITSRAITVAPSAPLRARGRGRAIEGTPTRELILNAAARLFAAHGFARATMPAIAALSGITAGAIYRHFDSKAELLLEVVKRALEAMPLSFERSSREENAALLPKFAARITDPELTLLRQLAVEVHVSASRDPEVRKLLAAYNKMVLRKFQSLIEEEQQANPHDTTASPEFTARALMVFLTGLNHMDILHPQLVGDPAWRDFVASHVAMLLGLRRSAARQQPAVRGMNNVKRRH